jgi:5,10-methylene-tetrahydrofolate dehydrogenase/methenyl tetrahydrofolate cyclohydrolase
MSLQTREVLLEWSLELEVRKFGIKSFIVTVPEQTFEIEFTKYNERLDEDSRIEETIIVKNVIVDINATKLQHGISPKSLTFYNDKWTLEF